MMRAGGVAQQMLAVVMIKAKTLMRRTGMWWALKQFAD